MNILHFDQTLGHRFKSTLPPPFGKITYHIYIYRLVQVTPGVTFSNVTLLNNFLLDVFFDKSIVELYFLLMIFFYM